MGRGNLSRLRRCGGALRYSLCVPELSRAAVMLRVGLVAAAVGLVDQLSKAWAYGELRGEPAIKLWPGRLEFDFALNPAAAFGFASNFGSPRIVLLIFAVCVAAVLGWLAWRFGGQSRWLRLGAGLAIGGGLSNAADRLHRVHEFPIYFRSELSFDQLMTHGAAIRDAMATGRAWTEVEDYGVVDFIVVYWAPHRRWPAFNLADVALTAAAVAICVWVWRKLEPAGSAPAGSDSPHPEATR